MADDDDGLIIVLFDLFAISIVCVIEISIWFVVAVITFGVGVLGAIFDLGEDPDSGSWW